MTTIFRFLAMVAITISSLLFADEEDQIPLEKVKKLVTQGHILSLEKIFAMHQDILTVKGKVIDVELETGYEYGADLVYEIKVLDNEGLRWEYYVDAFDGKTIQVERDD